MFLVFVKVFLHRKRCENINSWSILGKFQKCSKTYWNMSGDLNSPFWNNSPPQKQNKIIKNLENPNNRLIRLPYFGPY